MAVFMTGGKAPSLVNYVEYLESTGTQYVDTGFKANQDTRMVIDCQVLNTNTSNAHISSAISSGYYYNLFLSVTVSAISTRYGNNASQNFGSAVSSFDRITIDKNKNVTTIGDNSITSTAVTFQLPVNQILFARNNAGTADQYCNMRLYSCQIYDNGTLVRDFWPCYDPDGVACLHDKVEKKYYYNAGTGEFTAG